MTFPFPFPVELGGNVTSPPGVSPLDTDLPVLGQDDGGLSTLTTPQDLPSIPFDAPLVNPSQSGLYSLVDWENTTGPSRWLGEGVYFRPFNYGGAAGFGVWGAAWCGVVEEIIISGTGGTWTYTYNSDPTTALAVNITDDELAAAIEALPDVQQGQTLVTSPSPGIYLISHKWATDTTTSVNGADLTGPAAGATIQPATKTGERPDDGYPFPPITVYGADECGVGPESEAEILVRAQQNIRLLEPIAVERELAERLLVDAGGDLPTRADIVSATAYLEGLLAETGTIGVIHASAEWAAQAVANHQVPDAPGAPLKTRLGHPWAFGGGYVQGLGNTLVATSPVYGWRDDVVVRTAIGSNPYDNRFIAIAERSVVVGYEELIGAVTISAGP